MKKLILVFLFFHFLSLNAQEQPNILWFVSEDNSPFLGAYGDTIVHTPTLDKLAREGIVFDNAFSNAPVCAPSRSTIITGVLPPALGSQHMRSEIEIDSSIRFFPQYLKQAGYFTTLRLKRDYNIPSQSGTWDTDDWWHLEDAFEGRKNDQPFFMFYNTWMTHEGKIHDHSRKHDYFESTFERLPKDSLEALKSTIKSINPEEVTLPAYLPDIPEVRKDMALYYEFMQMLDIEYSHVIQKLESMGELNNTIIIYSSDHGGVLGRSKRFPFESGLHVPLIVKFPSKYNDMAPLPTGSRTDIVVSFVDMAPTILDLAGIEIPQYMHGMPFLNKNYQNRERYAFGFRGRMDESYDMVRTIRNKEFRYIRNFFPDRPHGQHITYLWQAANVRAWESAFLNGDLNEVQSAFFEQKAPEELYEISCDSDNVQNLATDPDYEEVLKEMRNDLSAYMKDIEDLGLVPEGMLHAFARETGKNYQEYYEHHDFENILSAAENATLYPEKQHLLALMNKKEAAERFWGAYGCSFISNTSDDIQKQLKILLKDPSGDVRVVAAHALYFHGQKKLAIEHLDKLLDHSNSFVVLRTLNTIDLLEVSSPSILAKLKDLKNYENESFDYVKRKSTYLYDKDENHH